MQNNNFALIKLVGDLATLTSPPSISNKFFMLPADTQTAIDGTYQFLLDSGMVSLDGMTCNKVGTSYNAFNTQQSNACN
jgi:hypothetical protein